MSQEVRKVYASQYPLGTQITVGKSPYVIDEESFAVVFDPEDGGREYDVALNMDTAKALANEGYLVLVLGHVEDYEAEQHAINDIASAYADCYGKAAQVVAYWNEG